MVIKLNCEWAGGLLGEKSRLLMDRDFCWYLSKKTSFVSGILTICNADM